MAAVLQGEGADPELVEWHELTYAEVTRLRGELVEVIAAATFNRYMTCLRSVLREAWASGLLAGDDRDRLLYALHNVRVGKLQRGRALERGEVATLVGVCRRDAGASGLRDAAVLCVMLGSALRRDEVARLDVGDVDLVAGIARVKGKARQEREVPLNATTREAIAEWIARRGRRPGPLFVAIRGGRVKRSRLGPSALWRIVSKRAKAAGLPRTSPHDCRRTAATAMLAGGADLAVVQRVLGHANVATTCRYDRRGLEAERRATDLLDLPGAEVAR